MKVMKNSIKGFITMFVMMAAFCVSGITANAYGVTQTAQTKDSVTVTWSPESNAVEYYVSVGKDYTDAEAAVPQILPATATSYTIKGLQPGTEYYVRVQYKYKGYADYYTGSVGSESVKTIPAKVSGLNQTRWWYYAKSVDFEWDAQSAAKYEYVVRNNKNKVVASDAERYYNGGSMTGVNNNMVYNVQVRAYVEINNQKYYGEWSDKAYLFTQPMVKSAKISRGKLKITWHKVNGISSYDVYVSTKEKSGYKKVKTLNSKKTSVTVSKLKGKKFNSKKKYFIYIVGKKKAGGKTYTSGRHYTYKLTKGKTGELRWTFD